MSEGIAVVTGVGGCVGSAVARVFAARGYEVRGLVRDKGAGWAENADGYTEHVGDLTRPDSLRELCNGANTVVHTAAMVDDWGAEEAFYQANCEGTKALLEEAQRSRVGRFVFVSTIDVFGFRNDVVIDEETPKVGVDHPYSRTKLEAENLAWSFQDRGMEVSVVYPTWIFGPGDRHLVPELVRGLRSGQLVYFSGGKAAMELTYNENLADAIALVAGSKQAAGEGYIVSDGFGLSFKGFVELVAKAAGLRPPRFSVPYSVGLGMGAVSEAVARARRSATRPLMTRYAVREIGVGPRYDVSKLESLGYRPAVGVEEAVRRSVAALAPA